MYIMHTFMELLVVMYVVEVTYKVTSVYFVKWILLAVSSHLQVYTLTSNI